MADRIRIVGARSARGQVSIQSELFLTEARSNQRGEITGRVKVLPRLTRFLLKNRTLPIPRLLRLSLFLIAGMSLRELILMAFYSVGMSFLYRYLTENFSWRSYGQSVYWMIYAGIAVTALFYIKKYIAPWHGAEHMVVSAYEKGGSVELERVIKENPISVHCGSRLVLPLSILIALMAVLSTSQLFPVSTFGKLVLLLSFLEGILWVDTLVGWQKVPLASYTSYFLQKYLLTCEPGERELRTAQKALEELVAAHSSMSTGKRRY